MSDIPRVPVPPEHLVAELWAAGSLNQGVHHLESHRYLRLRISGKRYLLVVKFNILHREVSQLHPLQATLAVKLVHELQKIQEHLLSVQSDPRVNRSTSPSPVIRPSPAFIESKQIRSHVQQRTWDDILHHHRRRLRRRIESLEFSSRRWFRRSLSVQVLGDPLMVQNPGPLLLDLAEAVFARQTGRRVSVAHVPTDAAVFGEHQLRNAFPSARTGRGKRHRGPPRKEAVQSKR